MVAVTNESWRPCRNIVRASTPVAQQVRRRHFRSICLGCLDILVCFHGCLAGINQLACTMLALRLASLARRTAFPARLSSSVSRVHRSLVQQPRQFSSVLGSQVSDSAAAANNALPVKRVLVSVFDKAGLVELCEFLAGDGVGAEIVSTGGTASLLRDHGIPVRDVSELTSFPEILGGRVKSLHPAVHGGILAVRSNEAHAADLAEHGIGNIDMVIGNLYPFEEAVAGLAGDSDDDLWVAAENVDIGGPTMIRGAAKNHGSVAVVTSPEQYADVQRELASNDATTSLKFRRRLAGQAFALTARYEAAISDFFESSSSSSSLSDADAPESALAPRDTRWANQPSFVLRCVHCTFSSNLVWR